MKIEMNEIVSVVHVSISTIHYLNRLLGHDEPGQLQEKTDGQVQ